MQSAPAGASTAEQTEDTAVIECQLLFFLFRSRENGFCVVRVRDATGARNEACDKAGTFIAAGILPANVAMNDILRLAGRWKMHPRYGMQFSVVAIDHGLPATAAGLQKYLMMIAPGVGPKTAERLMQVFGAGEVLEEFLDTAQLHPPARAKLAEIIGEERANGLLSAWGEKRAAARVEAILLAAGFGERMLAKIRHFYGATLSAVISASPWRLCRDILGISFEKADAVAKQLGFADTHPDRLAEGLVWALENTAELDGHVCLPESTLLGAALEALELSGGESLEALKRALEENAADATGGTFSGARRLVRDASVQDGSSETLVYLPSLHAAETGISDRLSMLCEGAAVREPQLTSEAALGELNTEQKVASHAVLCGNACSILTGGPGTGKSFTIMRIVRALQAAGELNIALAAPTGKAAKRMRDLAEAANLNHSVTARTIHRLLGWRPNGFTFKAANPLRESVVIVDETSMVGTELMDDLVQAIAPGAQLLLVGDPNQLPPVPAGRPFNDLIAAADSNECGKPIEVHRLNRVIRQAAGSGVAYLCEAILEGNVGRAISLLKESEDVEWYPVDDAADAANAIADAARGLIEEGADPLAGMQVLAPMRKGGSGVIALNEILAPVCNPARENEDIAIGMAFDTEGRAGDKVSQIVNNYPKNVFNGDQGKIISIEESALVRVAQTFSRGECALPLAEGDDDEGCDETGEATVSSRDTISKARRDVVWVDFDGRRLPYLEAEARDQLVPAFALTMHKSQGSEWPVVIAACTTQSWHMLSRNLFYTAASRAKGKLIIVGQQRALAQAIANVKPTERFGGLLERLCAKEGQSNG